jgi:IS30 family transposase
MSELNNRPRKSPGYDTPSARYRAEIRRPQPDMPAPAGSSAS